MENMTYSAMTIGWGWVRSLASCLQHDLASFFFFVPSWVHFFFFGQ